MKSPLVLTALLSLAAAELCHSCGEGKEERATAGGMQTQTSAELSKLPLALLGRLANGQRGPYEALLRLAAKDHARPRALVPAQKRDMQDFFVGLMGKRTLEPGAHDGDKQSARSSLRS
ncbi:tachykinin-3 isoform X2 [Carettochelys insculpta]|uniref:tachykinin-3 isoform X2 n=1 Tax=Carettochelys insculpta TaxID=44489 RepID=UPI003EC1474E